jgi:monothiol glutaredoxin
MRIADPAGQGGSGPWLKACIRALGCPLTDSILNLLNLAASQPDPEDTMTPIERIEQQLSENPVILYMKGTPAFPQCGFSGRAVQILEQCDVRYAHVNIFEDPELRENLKLYSNWPTFPQLYIKGELVGGSDIMLDLFQKGELQKKLAAVAGH